MRTIIERDDGAARLGEVALVDREGRIGALDTIFYDTLLDENAASHIALGAGFPFVIDRDEDRGRVNDSQIHIDFMIGCGRRRGHAASRATASASRCCAAAPGSSERRYPDRRLGEVPERLNGHDWKSCDGG